MPSTNNFGDFGPVKTPVRKIPDSESLKLDSILVMIKSITESTDMIVHMAEVLEERVLGAATVEPLDEIKQEFQSEGVVGEAFRNLYWLDERVSVLKRSIVRLSQL